jgi:hypothetical protein
VRAGTRHHVYKEVVMAHVRATIEVERPVTTVYDQWTQFEDFPQFMEGVERPDRQQLIGGAAQHRIIESARTAVRAVSRDQGVRTTFTAPSLFFWKIS